MQTRYFDLMSSLTLEPLEIPLFSRMIMPDRIELVWWRTCLKLKQYSVWNGQRALLTESNRACLGYTRTTDCCATKATCYCPRLGDCTS
ncbi:hypothetical protein TNCV_3878031 [Trichonephila clavipes]|nr:hypothetical protein TNCV_3878031 [Trichonephila clavipes]